MEKWKIIPGLSANSIEFGETRDLVRKRIGKTYKEFRKTPFSENTTDAYEDYHVYYDKNNLFEAIEFFGDVKVYIGRSIVFPGKITKALTLIDDLSDDGYGYTSLRYSVGITVDSDYATKIDGILFGCYGYYE